MSMTVAIDCYFLDGAMCDHGQAVVAMDVIRATTTAITAVATGRRCFPVTSTEEGFHLSRRLDRPLLAGELGGIKPDGFEMNNSPAEVATRLDVSRPLILLSSSGTKLLWSSRRADAVYLACFRNAIAVADHIANLYQSITIIGAGTLGEFREEDQICAAWVAARLMDQGYSTANYRTAQIVDRWREAPASACLSGNSAAYLRRSGQEADLDFVVSHVNDLEETFMFQHGEVVRAVPVAPVQPAVMQMTV
jgi:2-phosphosulfolactate phosphatase